ncbi:unnamed protein product [Acanthoscelides obtectus]|uniref:MADF domain-containing protein n=1 Tax=Acanthoscelides obtectus TaxID=200917 RepID=A0A9P0P2R6_ACAOB|nr:unnamed protein product [Acanthoscelides obtectus]CAK1634251.1 hypothetical protein AOBTE_LOCUS8693 [Acanthoscelides obtectus]
MSDMKSNNIYIDIEILIAAIQEETSFWDFSCEDYKNRDKKYAAFERVAKMVIADFGNMFEQEKKDSVNLRLLSKLECSSLKDFIDIKKYL